MISSSSCSMRGAVSSRAAPAPLPAPIPSVSLIRAAGRAVRRPNRGTVKGSAAMNPDAAPAAAAPVISRRAASALAIGAAALALLPCTPTTTHAAAAAAAAAEPGLRWKPAAAEDTSTDPAGSEMTLYVVPAGGSEKAGPTFRSISEAVSAAAPGARILIAAGSYRERLILSQPVSLEAFPEVADGMDLGKSVWCLGYVV